MLLKKYRLSKKERLIQPIFNSFLFFKTIKTQIRDASMKFAVVIPKKIEKKAVDRNRSKRLTYSILEDFIKNKKLQAGRCVLIAKNKILKAKKEDLKKEIQTLFV